jgi:hypothetical protein
VVVVVRVEGVEHRGANRKKKKAPTEGDETIVVACVVNPRALNQKEKSVRRILRKQAQGFGNHLSKRWLFEISVYRVVQLLQQIA